MMVFGLQAAAATHASQPATEPVAPPPPSGVESIAERLDWSEAERTILGAVEDFEPQIAGEALGMILRRAEGLEDLPASHLSDLDRPAYKNLLERPGRYRGEAVRLVLYLAYVKKLFPREVNLPESRWWPSDKPIWRLDGFGADTPYPADEPLRIFSVVDPASIISVPQAAQAEEEIKYLRTPAIEVAAVFYKVYTDLSRGDPDSPPTQRNYPVLVAWNIKHANLPGGEPTGTGSTAGPTSIVLIVAVALAALFIVLKLRARRRGRPRPGTAPSHGAPGPPSSGSDQVDPKLRAAAEQYRKKEHCDDDKNDIS